MSDGAAIHRYRNTVSGVVADLTEDQASAFPEVLEQVADDAKSFEPGLFKPGKVGEFKNPEPLTDSELAEQAAKDAEKQAKADAKAAHTGDAS